MKKVIFVAGTSFSGSTMLHLALANDPHGFAVGELIHLFHPVKKNHVLPSWTCGCGDPNCRLWERVKKNGEDHWVESVLDEHPEVDFIVDSSKNVLWMESQGQKLAKKGYDVSYLTIWKTPLEYAHSLNKRNQLQRLHNWTRYHRLALSVLPEWRAVAYAHSIQDPVAMEAACDYVGIPYFDGKERFWEKTQHVLGGNPSARRHLSDNSARSYADPVGQAIKANADPEKLQESYRTVYYERPNEEKLAEVVDAMRKTVPLTDETEAMLRDYDILGTGPSSNWSDLRFSQSSMLVKQAKQSFHENFGFIMQRL